MQQQADDVMRSIARRAAARPLGDTPGLLSALREGEHAAMLAMQSRLEESAANSEAPQEKAASVVAARWYGSANAHLYADTAERAVATEAEELRRLDELLALAVATENATASRDAEARARFRDSKRAQSALRIE